MNTTTVSAAGKEYHYGDKYSRVDRGPDQRKNPDKPRGFQIAEMWDSHHEIARRIILGEKGCDIAKSMNITEATVSSVRNSPVVQDKMIVMRAARDAGTIELSKEIQDLAPLAILRMREAIEEGKVLGKELSASGIMKEANNLLDREMGKATQRVETKNAHAHFTLDDIERIKQKARDLAGSSGQMALEY